MSVTATHLVGVMDARGRAICRAGSGAINRYPRRGIVSTNRGCRAWSPSARRICRML